VKTGLYVPWYMPDCCHVGLENVLEGRYDSTQTHSYSHTTGLTVTHGREINNAFS
jgi:hypothetical protein